MKKNRNRARLAPLLLGLLVALFLLPWQKPAYGAADAVTITLNPSSITPGGTVTATVRFTGSTGLVGIETVISIPSDIVESFEVSGTEAATTANSVHFIYLSSTSAGETSGTLGTIKMKIKASAAAGTQGTLSVTKAEGSGGSGTIAMSRGSATISVAAAKSSNANLASLSVSGVSLSPAFAQSVTSYKATVPYDTSSVTLAASAADAKAKVSGTGTKKLNVGNNTLSVTVTAENGAVKTYKVVITRQADGKVSSKPVNAPSSIPSSQPPISSSEANSSNSSSTDISSAETSSQTDSSDMTSVEKTSSAESSSVEPEYTDKKGSLNIHVLYIGGMLVCLAAGAMLGYFIRGKRQG